MGYRKLAADTGMSEDRAKEVFDIFQKSFPKVFLFLDGLGKRGRMSMCAADIGGRKRRWARPTREMAIRNIVEDKYTKLKKKKVITVTCKTYEEKVLELSRLREMPNDYEVSSELRGLMASVERESKNHPIQASNATIAKLAMGHLVDENGVPYLWIIAKKYNARIINWIYDELIYEVPEDKADEFVNVIGDAISRAGARFMKKLPMQWEGSADRTWHH